MKNTQFAEALNQEMLRLESLIAPERTAPKRSYAYSNVRRQATLLTRQRTKSSFSVFSGMVMRFMAFL